MIHPKLTNKFERFLHSNLPEQLSTHCNIVSEFTFRGCCLTQHQMDRCIVLILPTQRHLDFRPAVRQRVVVSYRMIIPSCLALIAESYHLMIVGSLFESVPLFVLSLAKPGQFYLVSSTGNVVDESLDCVLCVLGFYTSGCPRWDWDRTDICS